MIKKCMWDSIFMTKVATNSKCKTHNAIAVLASVPLCTP